MLHWQVFMEYYFVDDNVKCVQNCSEDGLYPSAEANCADLSTSPNGACWGTETVNGVKPAASQGCDVDCYPTEDTRNNFIALRRPLEGLLYVEYETGNQTAGDLVFEVNDPARPRPRPDAFLSAALCTCLIRSFNISAHTHAVPELFRAFQRHSGPMADDEYLQRYHRVKS